MSDIINIEIEETSNNVNIEVTRVGTKGDPGVGDGNATKIQDVAVASSAQTPTEADILVYRSGEYVLEQKPAGGANPAWGDISGTLSNQTDLQAELDAKQNLLQNVNYKVIESDFDFTNIPVGYDNATWFIRYDHDFGTNTITLPDNVTLHFQGGKFANGTLTGLNTKIEASLYSIFSIDLLIDGTWDAKSIVYPQWWSGTDSQKIQSAVDFFPTNEYSNVTFGYAGTIEFSGFQYSLDTTINILNKRGLNLSCAGSLFEYTGTGVCFDFESFVFSRFEGAQIILTQDLVGVIGVQLFKSERNVIDVSVGASSGTHTNTIGINTLGDSTGAIVGYNKFENCFFRKLGWAMVANAHFNANIIIGCRFNSRNGLDLHGAIGNFIEGSFESIEIHLRLRENTTTPSYTSINTINNNINCTYIEAGQADSFQSDDICVNTINIGKGAAWAVQMNGKNVIKRLPYNQNGQPFGWEHTQDKKTNENDLRGGATSSNWLKYSNDFTQWSNTGNDAVVVSPVAGVDGSDAYRVTQNTVQSELLLATEVIGTARAKDHVWTASVWMRSDTPHTSTLLTQFNNGSAINKQEYSYVTVDTEWRRYFLELYSTNVGSNYYAEIILCPNKLFDGSDALGVIDVWGAQIQQGVLGSLMKTDGSEAPLEKDRFIGSTEGIVSNKFIGLSREVSNKYFTTEYSSVLPTDGDWRIGDIIKNSNPVVISESNFDYIISGWSRITDGTSNILNTDWVEQRTVKGGITGGSSPLTTKGDIYTYDTADSRLAVGSNGQVLTADNAEATGLKWSTIPGGGDLLSTNNLSDVASDVASRSNLGVEIGVDVQAHSAVLDGITNGGVVNKFLNEQGNYIYGFRVDDNSPVIPISWVGTQAQFDAQFPSGAPSDYFVIITDGAVTPTSASDIVNVPSGNLTATNQQAANDQQQGFIDLNTAKVGVTDQEKNTINSIVTGEPTGSNAVLNVVSLTQAEYDAGTPIATTLYVING